MPRHGQFARLSIEDWRQFDYVELDFHPSLTVLTGANASGKSTILGMLAKHFNWTRVYSSAPAPSRIRDAVAFWSNLGRRVNRLEVAADSAVIGQLVYGGSNFKTALRVPTGAGSERQQYDITFDQGQQQVEGIYLTSHRYVSGNYAPVASIPALFGGPSQLLDQFTNEIRTRWLGSWSGRTPQLTLKESLIASAVFGEGNSSVTENPTARQVWLGFQRILGVVLPSSLGFRQLRVRMPDLVVETATGDFIFEEASGGLSSLIELSWQIFLRSQISPAFVVLLDEPENHLHPSLQRDVLPSLLRAFPEVQFIVATHSPFVVTAAPDSFVYVLDYDPKRRVRSRRLDYANKAASAERTLTRVLGVESTMPRWAEEKFDAILERYIGSTLTSDQLHRLRRELEANGLESEFPVAVATATEASPFRERGR